MNLKILTVLSVVCFSLGGAYGMLKEEKPEGRGFFSVKYEPPVILSSNVAEEKSRARYTIKPPLATGEIFPGPDACIFWTVFPENSMVPKKSGSTPISFSMELNGTQQKACLPAWKELDLRDRLYVQVLAQGNGGKRFTLFEKSFLKEGVHVPFGAQAIDLTLAFKVQESGGDATPEKVTAPSLSLKIVNAS